MKESSLQVGGEKNFKLENPRRMRNKGRKDSSHEGEEENEKV